MTKAWFVRLLVLFCIFSGNSNYKNAFAEDSTKEWDNPSSVSELVRDGEFTATIALGFQQQGFEGHIPLLWPLIHAVKTYFQDVEATKKNVDQIKDLLLKCSNCGLKQLVSRPGLVVLGGYFKLKETNDEIRIRIQILYPSEYFSMISVLVP